MKQVVGEMKQFVGEMKQFVGEMKQISWGNEAKWWANEAKSDGEMPHRQSVYHPPPSPKMYKCRPVSKLKKKKKWSTRTALPLKSLSVRLVRKIPSIRIFLSSLTLRDFKGGGSPGTLFFLYFFCFMGGLWEKFPHFPVFFFWKTSLKQEASTYTFFLK